MRLWRPTTFVGLLGLTMLAAGCGSTSGGTEPAGLAKPASAKQAVVDAQGRTANFKDVRYSLNTTSARDGEKTTTTEGHVSATRNPAMTDTHVSTSDGKKFESISNDTAKVFCTIPEGGPAQRFPNQDVSADAIDPFSIVLKDVSNWRYLDDATVNGHKDWHLIGDHPKTPPTSAAANVTYDLITSELWIDSRSGKIERHQTHSVGTQNGKKFDQVVTYQDFVYDKGVTITPCS